MLLALFVSADTNIVASNSKECSDAGVALKTCSSTTLMRGASSFAGPDEVNPGYYSADRCTNCKDLLSTYYSTCYTGAGLDYLQSAAKLMCLQDSGTYCATSLTSTTGTSLPTFDCNNKCHVKWASQLTIVSKAFTASGMTVSSDAKARLSPDGWVASDIDNKCGKNFLEKNDAWQSTSSLASLYFLSFQ